MCPGDTVIPQLLLRLFLLLLLFLQRQERLEVLFHLQRKVQPVIHIRRFLEPARALEAIGSSIVFGPRDPTDVVVRIEREALIAVSGREELSRRSRK